MIDFSIMQLFPDFLLADKNGFAMAKAIETALAALVVKPTATPAPVVTATPQPPVTIPQTGDSMNVTLLFALTLCSGAALGLAAHKKNRS